MRPTTEPLYGTAPPEVDTIYQCDALALLGGMAAGSVSSIITDPPYGAKVAYWDDDVPPQRVLSECLRVSSGPVIWFGGRYPQDMGKILAYEPKPDRILIWHVTFAMVQTSGNGMFYRWHPIYCWRLPETQEVIHRDVIECVQNGADDWWHHPGTKPLSLMERLVKAFGGDLVCDPFCGSGTTAVAAANTGRHYVCGDLDAGYVEIARRRVSLEFGAATLPVPETEVDLGPLFAAR